jgi:hypothetical protein
LYTKQPKKKHYIEKKTMTNAAAAASSSSSSSRILRKNMDEQIQPIMNVAEEKTWPVMLYRCESDGWKKQELIFESAVATTSNTIRTNSLHHHTVRRKNTNHFVVVAPRKDCVVFPHLRQRFSLKSNTDQGTVIRRDDKILLTSKRRVRALMLQFQSLQDCLDFTDHFLLLNNPPQHHRLWSSSTSSLLDDNKAVVVAAAWGGAERESQPRFYRQQPASSEEQEQVVAHITRLLHDDEFLRFVHKVETYIARTDDGAKILTGLEERDLSSI